VPTVLVTSSASLCVSRGSATDHSQSSFDPSDPGGEPQRIPAITRDPSTPVETSIDDEFCASDACAGAGTISPVAQATTISP
jgi:hypothetical protein